MNTKTNCLLFRLIVTLFCLCLGSNSQSRPRRCGDRIKLNKAHPTIYISFLKRDKREPLFANESNEGIWLTLHNNTCWTITLPVFGVPEKLGNVGMFYNIEQARIIKNQEKAEHDTLPIGYSLRHVSAIFLLPSGKSVTFSLPKEHLDGNLKLNIQFNYQWEATNNVFVNDEEPKHFVNFFSSDLPLKESK